jgi:hypothetical protein
LLTTSLVSRTATVNRHQLTPIGQARTDKTSRRTGTLYLWFKTFADLDGICAISSQNPRAASRCRGILRYLQRPDVHIHWHLKPAGYLLRASANSSFELLERPGMSASLASS